MLYMKNNIRHLQYIFILLCVLLPNILTAGSTLSITESQTTYTDFDVDYYAESPGEFVDIEDIKKINFNKTISNKLSLGYQNDEYWFHVKVKNNTKNTQNMILTFTEVNPKHIDLYTITKKSTSKEKNGLSIPIHKRKIQESIPSFCIPLHAGMSKDVYLKLSTTYGMMGAIVIKKEKTFYENLQYRKYLYLAYFVATLTIIFYNLIFFLYFRDKAYLYYIIYVSLFTVWIASIKGLLLPVIDVFYFDKIQLLIPLFFTALMLFSKEVLETKVHYKKLDIVFNGYIYSSIAMGIIMLIWPQNGFYLMNIVSIPLLIILLLVSIWFLMKKDTVIAKIYITALSIYIFGMSILSALSLGYLDYTFLSSNTVVFVSIMEIILFSLLLAYRINLVRNESLESKEKLFRQQETERTRLFHAVGEKTKEIKRAKIELEEELRKKLELQKHLEHIASTDVMTDLYNRRAFFEIAELEVDTAKHSDDALTSIIIDIDHFKNINDTFGHDVGDTVITAVSKLMVLNTRTKDHIGRIGGEEFAVLMPKTSTEAAYQIADRLRENISKHSIAVEGHGSIKITVSIGLSTMVKDKDESIHTLLKRADTALYKAKNNGRNQVRCLPEIKKD